MPQKELPLFCTLLSSVLHALLAPLQGCLRIFGSFAVEPGVSIASKQTSRLTFPRQSRSLANLIRGLLHGVACQNYWALVSLSLFSEIL